MHSIPRNTDGRYKHSEFREVVNVSLRLPLGIGDVCPAAGLIGCHPKGVFQQSSLTDIAKWEVSELCRQSRRSRRRVEAPTEMYAGKIHKLICLIE